MLKVFLYIIFGVLFVYSVDNNKLFSPGELKNMTSKPDSLKKTIIAKREEHYKREIMEFKQHMAEINEIGLKESFFTYFPNFGEFNDEFRQIKKININEAPVNSIVRANRVLGLLSEGLRNYKLLLFLKSKKVEKVEKVEKTMLDLIGDKRKSEICNGDTNVSNAAEIYYMFFCAVPIFLQTKDTLLFYKKICYDVPLKIYWERTKSYLGLQRNIIDLLVENMERDKNVIYGFNDYYLKVTRPIINTIVAEFNNVRNQEKTEEFEAVKDNFNKILPKSKIQKVLDDIITFGNDTVSVNKLSNIMLYKFDN